MNEKDFKIDIEKIKVINVGDVLLTEDDVLNIPVELMPMPVLSDNLSSFFSWGIKLHEKWTHNKGNYNHFMWLHKQGTVASQNLFYNEQPISDYLRLCRLKIWYFPDWTPEQREKVHKAIQKHLDRPWYRKLYDVPAIFGQLFWHEIQTPGLDICSDSGSYLSEVDEDYDLRHPDPEEVNMWLEKQPEAKVYGRYLPD
jgi:hypothetical protein